MQSRPYNPVTAVETPFLQSALRAQAIIPGVPDDEVLLRAAAFERVRGLNESRELLTAAELKLGFSSEGSRIALVNVQRRVCKPVSMRQLLSVKTPFPKSTARIWYDDLRVVHEHIYGGDQLAELRFTDAECSAEESSWLRDAAASHVPIVYFLAISPRRYLALCPAFLTDWDATALTAHVAFGLAGDSGQTLANDPGQRQRALQAVKQRVHEASFREAVITAYKGRCALSGLPEPQMLDVARIRQDEDDLPGRPVVANGLPLAKIYLAAFDANLIGIDADLRIHVADRLMKTWEGAALEELKRMSNAPLKLPDRAQDRPDRDRLAIRFRAFLAAA